MTTIAGDETFERFRRKLADMVLVAVNSGKSISADWWVNGCHCPMGCHPDSVNKTPPSHAGAFLFGIAQHDASSFQTGFGEPAAVGKDPYTLLGALYRKRFP